MAAFNFQAPLAEASLNHAFRSAATSATLATGDARSTGPWQKCGPQRAAGNSSVLPFATVAVLLEGSAWKSSRGRQYRYLLQTIAHSRRPSRFCQVTGLRSLGQEGEPPAETGNAGDDGDARLSEAFAELDGELDDLKGKLDEELRVRGAALTEKVEALLAQVPMSEVQIAEAPANSSRPNEARDSYAESPLPELQRVVVCGASTGADGSSVASQLFESLQAASASALDVPRWLNLLEAAELPFETLDALLLGARAVVFCPDLEADDRRAIEAQRAGMKATLASFPANLSKAVLLSRIGAQAMKGGINMRSMFGLGYSGTPTGLEDELTSTARKRGRTAPLNVVIVRAGLLPAANLSSSAIRCLPGDADSSSSCTTTTTAAQALLYTLALSVDTNFCVVDEPIPTQDPAATDWKEQLLPFIGTEIWRIDVRKAERTAIFIQNWAAEWFGGAVGNSQSRALKETLRFGLKTPVQYSNTPTGVVFKFRPLDTPEGRAFEDLEEGGLEFVVEKPKIGSPRLRARRCAYGWKTIVKENSERAVLEKFRTDWAEVA